MIHLPENGQHLRKHAHLNLLKNHKILSRWNGIRRAVHDGMKGKTQLRKKHLRCSSLDTLPLSISALTLFTSNKTASSAGKIFSGSHKILLAIEQILSMAEPILSAVHKDRSSVEQILFLDE